MCEDCYATGAADQRQDPPPSPQAAAAVAAELAPHTGREEQEAAS